MKQVMLCIGCIMWCAGCLVHSHVITVPRVDQEAQTGNAGYIYGVPPVKSSPAKKHYRKIVEIDISAITDNKTRTAYFSSGAS